MDMKQILPMPLCMDDAGCPPNLTPPTQGGEQTTPSFSIDPDLLSLAMAFVPYQAWVQTYELDVALDRGTLFPVLDKPFLGKEALSHDGT